MKSYTDLEQSKKLAEILPIESADMWYQHTGISIKDGSEKSIYFPMVIRDCESDEDILCWSLSALLDVLPNASILLKGFDKIYDLTNSSGEIAKAENPVDACVAMIEKLNKLKML